LAKTIGRQRFGVRVHIGDFTQWKVHDAYSKAFDRLLRDLKTEAAGTVLAERKR
jgi:hypothetical protein